MNSLIDKNKTPIIFLHIPKVGGTTFESCLIKLSEENNLKFHRGMYPNIVAPLNLDENKFIKSNIDIFTGHFTFHPFIKKFRLICLLRDISKTFMSSLYFHYFRSYLQKKLNQNIMSLIFSKEKRLYADNRDINLVEDMLKDNNFISNPFTKTFAGIGFDKLFYTKNDYKISINDFNKAKKNIDFFDLIGFIENFDSFLKNFNEIFGFQIKNYEIKNTSNIPEKFKKYFIDKLEKKIIDYNSFDYKLVNYIKAKKLKI